MLSRLKKITVKICQILLLGLAYFILVQCEISLKCPIRTFLHIKCPGCGITRMFVCLARGQVKNAFYFNALILTLITILIPYSIYKVFKYVKDGNMEFNKYENAAVYIVIVIALIFGIVRNFSFWPLY